MRKVSLILIFLISIASALFLAFQASSEDFAGKKKSALAPKFIKDYKKATGHLPTQQEVVNALKH